MGDECARDGPENKSSKLPVPVADFAAVDEVARREGRARLGRGRDRQRGAGLVQHIHGVVGLVHGERLRERVGEPLGRLTVERPVLLPERGL